MRNIFGIKKIVLILSVTTVLFLFFSFLGQTHEASIISIRVTRYGFPLYWLETRYHTVEHTTEYVLDTIGILTNIGFCLITSFIIIYMITKTCKKSFKQI